jgi:hypothetical protein
MARTNNYFRCGGAYAFFDETDPASVAAALALIQKSKHGPRDLIVVWRSAPGVRADGYVGHPL